jgi:hypothetical protein
MISPGTMKAPLHAARERHNPTVFLVPQGQILKCFFDMAGICRFAEQSATEGHRSPRGFEGIGRQFLRHETDHGAGGAVVGDDVVTVHQNGPFAWIDDPADGADQRRLARAVGTQQCEDLALANVEIDVFESPETGGVGF